MKKIAMSLAAAGVLVAGAFVASTIADGPVSAQTGDEAQPEFHKDGARGEILQEVLGPPASMRPESPLE